MCSDPSGVRSCSGYCVREQGLGGEGGESRGQANPILVGLVGDGSGVAGVGEEAVFHSAFVVVDLGGRGMADSCVLRADAADVVLDGRCGDACLGCGGRAAVAISEEGEDALFLRGEASACAEGIVLHGSGPLGSHHGRTVRGADKGRGDDADGFALAEDPEYRGAAAARSRWASLPLVKATTG